VCKNPNPDIENVISSGTKSCREVFESILEIYRTGMFEAAEPLNIKEIGVDRGALIKNMAS
jgi:hypothetical protein